MGTRARGQPGAAGRCPRGCDTPVPVSWRGPSAHIPPALRGFKSPGPGRARAVPALSPRCPRAVPAMALALPLLLALLGTAPGLGAPGGGCGVPPSAWCQDGLTALRCGALGRCPRLGQGPPEGLRDPPKEDACALCQQLFESFRQISNRSAVEEPLKICVKLKLCPEPGAVPGLEGPGGHLQGPALSPLSLPLPRCWLCRSLVARAEAAVPVRSVAAAVAGLCRALPLPVVGACQCLAERYAALALEGLLGRLGPRLLCRLFLACDSGDSEHEGTLPPPRVLEAIVVRLADCVREEDPEGAAVPALSLSLGPCALGPIFWCSGLEAARSCQALQHCKDHVWL